MLFRSPETGESGPKRPESSGKIAFVMPHHERIGRCAEKTPSFGNLVQTFLRHICDYLDPSAETLPTLLAYAAGFGKPILKRFCFDDAHAKHAADGEPIFVLDLNDPGPSPRAKAQHDLLLSLARTYISS